MRGELSVAFADAGETGVEGSAAAGLALGAGALICASEKVNALSSAAVAQLNRFKELAIIRWDDDSAVSKAESRPPLLPSFLTG